MKYSKAQNCRIRLDLALAFHRTPNLSAILVMEKFERENLLVDHTREKSLLSWDCYDVC